MSDKSPPVKKKNAKKITKQKQKQSQKQVVNVVINPEKKTRKRKSTGTQSNKKQSQPSSINITTPISFPSMDQLYRVAVNNPEPTPYPTQNLQAEVNSFMSALKRNNPTNQVEAFESLKPNTELLVKEANERLKVENQQDEEVQRIKQGARKQLTNETENDGAAKMIQGAMRGHIARNIVRKEYDKEYEKEYEKEKKKINDAATKIQSNLRVHQSKNKAKNERKIQDMIWDEFVNTDMLEAIREAQKRGSGNVTFSSPSPAKKPTINKTTKPAIQKDHVSATLVFDSSPATINSMTGAPTSKMEVASSTKGPGRPKGAKNKTKEEKEQDKFSKEYSQSVLTRSQSASRSNIKKEFSGK